MLHGDSQLGHWTMSLLRTQGGRDLPLDVETSEGICLYAGDVYNWPHEPNDHASIRARVTRDPRELLRELRGEFAILLAHGDRVWFATDSFRTHSLWYYHDGRGVLSVASYGDVVRAEHQAAYQARANTIYEFDRATGRLREHPRREFDLAQHHDNYDRVFEALEAAVRERMTTNSITWLGSGMDSGTMLAAAHAQAINPGTVTVKFGERNWVLAERMRRHRSRIITYDGASKQQAALDRLMELHFGRFNKNQDTLAHMSIISKTMRGEDAPRVLVSSVGGDEFYADYGVEGKALRYESQFGGRFPVDLSLSWPWHHMVHQWLDRDDALAGFMGVARRYPLLDHGLVQAWLNTTQRLKNRSYKDWMRTYMDEREYPYQTIKKGYAVWRRDTADHARQLRTADGQRGYKKRHGTLPDASDRGS